MDLKFLGDIGKKYNNFAQVVIFSFCANHSMFSRP